MEKKIIITGKVDIVNRAKRYETFDEQVVVMGSDLVASDGYHTFDELYDHRITLFITLCKTIKTFWAAIAIKAEDFPALSAGLTTRLPWRSKLHSDGTSFDGWFVMGMYHEKGNQITYHLPLERWEETDFAETLEKAPEWDGHSAADVLTRLKTL